MRLDREGADQFDLRIPVDPERFVDHVPLRVGFGFLLGDEALLHHAMDHGAESDTVLRELSEKYADTMAFQVAEAHAARGETDSAYEWLERAWLEQDPGLADMKNSPHLRSLHGDPRWGAFMKKTGFEV